VRVWMDEGQIDPGARWMKELQKIIAKAPASIIFLGPHGLGRWQEPEIEACIGQSVDRGTPVVPVPLPGLPDDAEILLFLKRFSWVDLRKGSPPEELDRLADAVRAKDIHYPPAPVLGPSIRAPRLHNLPFSPLGDLLKGRDEELQRLIANLGSLAPATALTQAQAIHGLGGIGKTRLAVEYAWRSGDRYDAALFVVADSPEALRVGLASLARPGLLALPEYETGAEAKIIEAVMVWLREHPRWLLILDNIDTEEAAKAIKDILPQLGNGHVLLTSRRRAWPPAVRKQSLGELTREEATQFLLQRTDGERTPAENDAEQAGRLAEILDGLPLALEQAAAFIGHHQTTFARYLEDWEREREKVLEWHDAAVMDYPASVAATWQKTFSQLCPEGAAILRLSSFLAPEPIPEEMFEKGKEKFEEAAKALAEETGQQMTERTARDAFSDLAGFSMITRSAGNFTVHRVVQEVLRTRIPEGHRREWIERSLRLVNAYAPFEADDVRTWPIWHLLRPHAARIIEEADGAGIPSPTGRLMSMLALLLLEKSLYAQAEPLMRRALQIGEDTLGPQHPTVAIRLSNLVTLLVDTNRLTEAEPLMRRALQIDETSFGSQHPRVAIRLNNLAQLFQKTNRLSEAEPLMRRVVEILGPDQPNFSGALNNLAQLLKATNRLSEAEPLMRRALQIDEASFGTQHPEVAIDLNNLALMLQDKNRLSEAEPLMRRAVEIFEASLGPDHPRTQAARDNLEDLLANMRPGEQET
jgi:tetratricopeptide (TPR) repeat protein